MIPESQERHPLDRVRFILQQAEDVAWKRFPENLRPDTHLLRKNIIIDNKRRPTTIKLHPLMKPEIRADMESFLRTISETEEVTKVAWMDARTREMIIKPELFLDSDDSIQTVIYHEAGTDLVAHIDRVDPSDYSEFEIQTVQHVLNTAFENNIVPLENTHIEKMGFRRLLCSEGYDIADLVNEDLVLVDEVFPTMFELVTQQLVRVGGNMRAFERNLSKGNIRIDRTYDHVVFAAEFFKLAARAGWRTVLGAFSTGEFEDIFRNLGPESERDFNRLMSAMQEDELRVQNFNRFFGGVLGPGFEPG